jgi:hypothetical protein
MAVAPRLSAISEVAVEGLFNPGQISGEACDVVEREIHV